MEGIISLAEVRRKKAEQEEADKAKPEAISVEQAYEVAVALSQTEKLRGLPVGLDEVAAAVMRMAEQSDEDRVMLKTIGFWVESGELKTPKAPQR